MHAPIEANRAKQKSRFSTVTSGVRGIISQSTSRTKVETNTLFAEAAVCTFSLGVYRKWNAEIMIIDWGAYLDDNSIRRPHPPRGKPNRQALIVKTTIAGG